MVYQLDSHKINLPYKTQKSKKAKGCPSLLLCLRFTYDQCCPEFIAAYLSKDLAAHKPHKAFAYKQPQSVAADIISVAATMKTLEYLGEFLFFKGTASIRYCYNGKSRAI